MTLNARVFTANCGNGSLGVETCKQIVNKFNESEADLFIINCQEVHFDWALRELDEVKGDLKVTASPQMVTHTKFGTQFHNKTGMMTLILHKSDIKVEINESKEARRETKRFGRGFNKGGVLTKITATTQKGVKISLDNINAHLDAFSDAARAQDWSIVHRLQKHKVSTWKGLCDVIPQITCSGYDANTRNKLGDEYRTFVESQCAWKGTIAQDMQSLAMAPLGNARESRDSTYHSDNKNILDAVDRKRKKQNVAKGGMLDIVAYTDVAEAERKLGLLTDNSPDDELSLVKEAEVFINPEENGTRDHAVIGSREILIDKKKDFYRVRDAIACSLVDVAPQLAAYLLDAPFTKTEDNKTYLLTVYQRYLSPEGLLQKQLQLHADQLELRYQFQNQNLETLEDDFKESMFFGPESPWFGIHQENVAFTNFAGLNQLANYQENRFNLISWQTQFLSQAVSNQERLAIVTIVNNSLTQMSKNLTSLKQRELVKNTKQLLSINQLLHRYERHLPAEKKNAVARLQMVDENPLEEKEQDDDLLQTKKRFIADFKNVLLSKKNPGAIIFDLDQYLNDSETTLNKHRHDDWFSKLYRKLKLLIKGTDLSHGGFFVEEVREHIKGEDELIFAYQP